MAINYSELTYPATATACAVVGAVWDVKTRRIPNVITMPAFLFGLLLHLTLGGWMQMLYALTAGVACGVIFLIFYIAGGMGAGDVKLMMAVGCIAGGANGAYFNPVASIMILTAIGGGVMAVGLALFRGRLQQTVMNVGDLLSHHVSKGLQPHPDLNLANSKTLRLPYALAIAVGCILTLFIAYKGAA
jgi:prepilin peptidase CpaA